MIIGLTKRVFYKDDVQELRSKLMLITTGEDGKKNVSRYDKILNLIEALSNNLESLNQAGCNLFAKWKATIYCDPNRKVSLIVSFGPDSPIIQGDENLENNLHQTADFLKVSTFHSIIINLQKPGDCSRSRYSFRVPAHCLKRENFDSSQNWSCELVVQSLVVRNPL